MLPISFVLTLHWHQGLASVSASASLLCKRNPQSAARTLGNVPHYRDSGLQGEGGPRRTTRICHLGHLMISELRACKLVMCTYAWMASWLSFGRQQFQGQNTASIQIASFPVFWSFAIPKWNADVIKAHYVSFIASYCHNVTRYLSVWALSRTREITTDGYSFMGISRDFQFQNE